MKTAIILHGQPGKEEYYNPKRPAPSNFHWLAWIQRQLLLKDYLAQSPELPEPYYPDYGKWLSVFKRFDVDENTILIGHSRGAAFLVRWLSENKVSTDKVALVAPSMLAKGSKEVAPGFFDFEIDGNSPSRTKGVIVFYSSDDDKTVLDTVKLLREKTEGIEFVEFSGKGHLTLKDMGTDEFPELKEALLGK